MLAEIVIAAFVGLIILAIVMINRGGSGGAPRGRVTAPGRPSPAVLEGDGTFDFEVVGESHYQDAFVAIVGQPREDGYEVHVVATLWPDDGNRYDANAVAVLVEGRQLGHLSRDDAAEFREVLAELGHGGQGAMCAGLIVGGWRRERRGALSEGSYGLKLDLAWPPELASD